MMRTRFLILAALLLVAFVYGCSGSGGENPTAPTTGPRDAADGGTACLGFWQVTIDKNAGTIEAADMRTSDLMLNVLGFVEPPALSGMTIDFATLDIEDPIIEVDVILTHPIPDAVFTGFDVRGVVFGPKVTNCDGMTIVPGPEFFTGVPFGYQDGLLGAPNSVGHYTGLAGYKYFCDGLGKDTDLVTFMSNPTNMAKRGMFSKNPQQNRRHYVLDWTGVTQGFFVFNYAIYANYNWPTGTEPIDVNDFEITTSNSQEAFAIKVTETANSLWASGGVGGGSISMDVEIWDWQGNITEVAVESDIPDIIPESFFDVFVGIGSTAHSYVYQFTDVPGSPTEPGDLDLLFTVTDPMTFGGSWFMTLLPTSNSKYDDLVYSVFPYTTTVIECPVPSCTAVTPDFGMGILNDIDFTCTNLIDGGSLGVKFKKGATEWVGTDVQFISGTEMTADFDLTVTPPTLGDKLDIVIINGCSTEGTGPAQFEAFYYVKQIGTANMSVGSGTPKDIGCDPATDRVQINKGTQYSVWANNYATNSGNYSYWASFTASFTDMQSWGGLYGSQYVAPAGSYPIWCWALWTGDTGNAWWFGGYYKGMKDICNLQGTNQIWGLYDYDPSFAYFFQSTGSGSYGLPYSNGAPWYNGTGNNGVIMNNLLAIDMPPYTGTYQMYFLENLPASSTAVVEKYTLPTSYQWSCGQDFFYKPLDITTDSNGYVYVLDVLSSGNPRIWVYDSSGTLSGKSKVLTTTEISGTPLRLDAHNFATPDEVHVLHTNGVTRFSMY